MKKKICMLLTNAFAPDVRVYKEARYLVEQGCSVRILCWDRNPMAGYPRTEVMDGIKIIRFRRPSVAGTGYQQLGAFFGYIRDCRKYCKKKQFDYFHCNDFDGALVWAFLKRGPSKMIFDMHEYYEDVGKKPGFFRPVARWAMRKATIHMIMRSEYALYENDLYLQKPYRKIQKKLLSLKNYPDASLVRCAPKTKSSVFRIGYHGALRTQIPEFTTLFEAVKGMDDVRVDIHGAGPDLKMLKKLSRNYKNVFVHGPFNGVTELTGLYANTDVVFAGYRPYSYTREYEEVVKFFECILTGTPIILTEAYTGMGKRIQKYGFGLTCDTLSAGQVRASIRLLKDDRSFWETCRKNELREAKKYDWSNEVKILNTAYQLDKL